jgi:Fission yeast centromere protein N-terminal domain
MPRKAVSHSEKKALRTFYKQQHPRPSQKAVIAWFEQTYNRTLNQSIVSDYLSDRYTYLDDLDPHSFSD